MALPSVQKRIHTQENEEFSGAAGHTLKVITLKVEYRGKVRKFKEKIQFYINYYILYNNLDINLDI